MTEFVIHLRPDPGDVPADVRLRKLLKALLRRHGLRCIDVREVEAVTKSNPGNSGEADRYFDDQPVMNKGRK